MQQAESSFGKTILPLLTQGPIAADHSMSPPYIFKIDEIEEDPNAPSHVDNLGNWTPSTDAGANVRVGGGVSGRLWFCNRQRIFEVPQLPPEARRHKTFSVYYGGGYGFWVLRGDATEPPDGEVWLPLRFDHSDLDYSSFLTNAGLNPTLRVQRNDQRWPTMLLPDIYHASVRTDAQAYGGLTGELPIFLALLAFSLPRDYLPNMLPNLFTGGAWVVHGYQLPRTNQRGVIVTVYTSPSNWAGGSTSAELEHYEQGYLGKYFN